MTAAVVTPPRVRQRRAERQDQILLVATRAFAKHGPEAVRLDDIAAEVAMAKGTLYSHFPTKEALLVAIIEPALVASDRALRNIVGEDAVGVIKALLRQWAGLLREHHDAMQISHCLETKLPRALLSLHRRVVSKMHHLLSQPKVAGRLRGSPEWASSLIARLGLPLFDTYVGIDATGETFVEAVSHLLLRS
jgi:AcrR family transcriptional regulator